MRAEIIDTGEAQLKSASIIINASAQKIFAVLSNPHLHSVFDGSNTVKSAISGPEKLELGSKFTMRMKLGVRYRVTNRVVEFEENALIAWRHLGRWIWRYEIKQIANDQCVVIESFDGRPSPFQWWLNGRKAYGFAQIAAAKTLVRLKQYCEAK